MIEVNLALFADAANISMEKKLNVLGEFNSLTAAQPPWMMIGKYLVLRFQGSPGDVGPHLLGLRILDEDRDLVWASADIPFTFPASPVPGVPSRLLSVSPLPPIALKAAGSYEFEVLIDGVTRHLVELYAVLQSAAAPDAGQS